MQALIQSLFEKHLNLSVSNIEALTGGQVGNVFKVSTKEKDYVIKFVETWEEFPFEKEPIDDRVYGSRWSNLLPTYELLKQSEILTPNLYASGILDEEKLYYAIFDYLSGDSSDYSEEWFSLLAHHIGTIHLLNRSFQGWVAMKEPYELDWKQAFEQSFHSQLTQAKGYLDPELYKKVLFFVNENLKDFQSPEKFVLSHTDGIQAVFKKENNWEFKGVIDVEDYQFTDQRFVLAGIELTNILEGHSLPESFWKSYSEKIAIDSSYPQTKSLFQVYYLLVWIRVLQGQESLLKGKVSYLEELVK